MTIRDKVLSSVFGALILITIGVTVYVSCSPPPQDSFTEFYLLGTDGKADSYPRALAVGEEGRVILGIVNLEHEKTSYQVVIKIDEVQYTEIGPVILENEGRWEQEVNFIPDKAGEDIAVTFSLYKAAEQLEYIDSLYLRLDVTE